MGNKTGKGKVNATERAEREAKEREAEALKQKHVAEDLQKVLESHGYALQPFMTFSEYGVAPSVRLVVDDRPKAGQDETLEIKPESDDGEETNSGEVGGSEDQHESSESEQA